MAPRDTGLMIEPRTKRMKLNFSSTDVVIQNYSSRKGNEEEMRQCKIEDFVLTISKKKNISDDLKSKVLAHVFLQIKGSEILDEGK